MLIITIEQITRIANYLEKKNVELINHLIEYSYPEVYSTKIFNEWPSFIEKKMTESSEFGIHDLKNKFIYIITLSQFHQYFDPKLPAWAIDILSWPGRKENDKLVQLHKEILKKNQMNNCRLN